MELVFGPSVDVGRQAVIGKKENNKDAQRPDSTATQSYAELCRLHGGMYSALINTSPFFCLKKCHAGLQESRPFWCFDQSLVD